MIINHNMSAMNAHRQMGINNNMQTKSMEKLSSGQRINRAGDDAAGLAISEKMRGQIRGLDQASRNAQDGISMIQTAEGALGETQNILQRMRELAVQAGNDTNTTDDRKQIQQEINQLTNEVNRISNTTEFNTQKLIDGSAEGGFKLQIGANENQSMTIGIKNMGADALGITGKELEQTGKIANGALTTETTTKTVNLAADIQIELVSATNSKTVTIDLGAGEYTLDNIKEAIMTGIEAGDKDAFGNVSIADDGSITVAAGNDGAITVTGDIGTPNIVNKETFNEDLVATIGGKEVTLAKKGDVVDLDKMNTTLKENGIDVTFAKEADGGFKLTGTGVKDLALSSKVTAGDGTVTTPAVTVDKTAVKGDYVNGITNGTDDKEIGSALDVSTHDAAKGAITKFDKAINNVSTERAKLGSFQNRLEHTIANVDTSAENLQAAESRVRDVDMAKEMLNFSKSNILSQASQAMLAQAKQAPQGVLQLLR